MNGRKNMTGRYILAEICFLPWQLTLLYSIYSMYAGCTVLFGTTYGINAFLGTWLVLFYVGWWAYIPGVIAFFVCIANGTFGCFIEDVSRGRLGKKRDPRKWLFLMNAALALFWLRAIWIFLQRIIYPEIYVLTEKPNTLAGFFERWGVLIPALIMLAIHIVYRLKHKKENTAENGDNIKEEFK
ncbi:MAG: hypothetical protein K6F71_00525 [Ruminococcus sp.]|uniref:hypothetical protein n=1 Tax=Ruminococcus sp. TaxID=41978 RepID=UPI002600D5E8|nr:hypothetical protein [Ruminococcus sp.]MCR5539308.1 hypothetical protein [Ruminococcus sp.]